MAPNWLELISALLGLALLVWGARMETRQPYWAEVLDEVTQASELEQVLDERRR